MRTILVITFSLLLSLTVSGQEFVTDDTIESTAMKEDGQLKVLYFTASWCGPCRYMKPIIKSIDEDESINVTFYKLDIDKNVADNILGVSSVPTYFFLKNGYLLGRGRSAMSENKMLELIERHDKMDITTGSKLVYRSLPSKYEIVAGSHPKLTVNNLKSIWHSAIQLNKLAWNIYQKLENTKDVECAIVLSQRSIELDKSTSNLITYAHLLSKNGEKQKALKVAKNAKQHAEKNNESTAVIADLIEQIKT